jgi:hypothetical protein
VFVPRLNAIDRPLLLDVSTAKAREAVFKVRLFAVPKTMLYNLTFCVIDVQDCVGDWSVDERHDVRRTDIRIARPIRVRQHSLFRLHVGDN